MEPIRVACRAAYVAVAVLGVGCGSSGSSTFAGKDAGSADAGHAKTPPVLIGGTHTPLQCTGIQCRIPDCSSGSTNISGTIYDPAGRNPLYGVVAYVPNSKPKPFPVGASCASCDSLYTGDPIATAITDASGRFTLSDVPSGADIPLVLQVGKWRKQLIIPYVEACEANELPDRSLTLPKNHEVGDIPMIAVSTGGSDTLECLLSRIGLDDSEYSPGATAAGHIQIYPGGTYGVVPNTSPKGPQSAAALWDTTADLMRYDILLLSCQGEETVQMNQPALLDYTSAGGRVFASHFHYAWFNTGPFAAQDLSTWTPGNNDMNTIGANIATTLPGGGAFPKGEALQAWLTNVGALHDGELTIYEAKHNSDVGKMNPLSTPWISADSKSDPPNATQYFSFDTPLAAAPADVCGRVVYSDLHVGAISRDDPSLPVPAECHQAPLSAQEDALEFMLFDLSSCVIPVAQPPVPPAPIK